MGVRQRSSAFRRVDERTAKILGCLVRTEVQDGKGCRTCRASEIARQRTDQVERRGSPVLKVSTTPNCMQTAREPQAIRPPRRLLYTWEPVHALKALLDHCQSGLAEHGKSFRVTMGLRSSLTIEKTVTTVKLWLRCLCTLGSSGTAQGLVHDSSELGDGSMLMYRPKRRQ